MSDIKELYYPYKSLALSSSAGSGKTFALTTRLVSMLLSGVPPYEILAVTFTKLAAKEIREGIFQRVEAILKEDKPQIDIFCKVLGMNRAELIKKAAWLRQELVRQFSMIQVSTIHSFFSKIIMAFPKEAGIDVDFEVIDEIKKEELLKQALEEFYKALEGNPEALGRIFDFLKIYRDGRARTEKVIREIYEKVDEKYHILHKIIHEEALKSEEIKEEYFLSRRSLLSEGFERRLRVMIRIIEEYFKVHGEKKNLRSFVSALWDFLKYKRPQTLHGLTALKREKPVNYIESLCKDIKADRVREFSENLGEIKRAIRSYLIAEMRYYIDTWFDIFRRVHGIYENKKKELRAVDFTDIELQALEIFSRLDDFGCLDFRTDSRIRYVLIDEFQDTSELQWSALKCLVNQSLLKGGNIFYVGDVKQAIYRFRGGEAYLFEKVKDELEIAEEYLPYNYRQNQLLLDFVNDLFLKIKTAVFSPYRYEPQLLPKPAKGEKRGYLFIQQYEEKEALSQAILRMIELLKKGGVELSDIAILCRINSELEELEQLFLKNRIPFVSSGRSTLLDSYAVLDVMNLLRLVLRPDEPIYLAAFLRSPIVRYSYEELINLGDINLKRLANVDRGLFEQITSLVNSSSYLLPSDFLQRVYERFNLPELYSDSREQLLDLYEYAWRFESSAESITLEDFFHWLESNPQNLKIRSASYEGVRIQTIHSSKGLEYHSVIVPYLRQSFRFRLDWPLMFGRNEKKDCMIGAARYRDWLLNIPYFSEILEEEEKKYRIDELNILYVALTRARENLVILPLSRRGETVGDVLIDSVRKIYGKEHIEKGKIVRSDKKSMAGERRYAGVAGDRKRLLHMLRPREEVLPSGDLRRRRIGLLKGLLFHRVLELADVFPVDEKRIKELLKVALSQLGREYTKDERNVAEEQAEKSLFNVFTDSRLKKYFGNNALSEAISLSDCYENLIGRIDRVVIDNEIELVDFKTDALSEKRELELLKKEYESQINRYCSSLSKIYPDRSIKGYLYFTDAELGKRFIKVFQKGGL